MDESCLLIKKLTDKRLYKNMHLYIISYNKFGSFAYHKGADSVLFLVY